MKTSSLAFVAGALLALPTVVFSAVSKEGAPNIIVEPSDKETVTRTKEAFLRMIRREQDDAVKVSVDPDNCFTEDDYERFKDEVPKRIVERLKKDADFTAITKKIAGFDAIERSKIYNEARTSYKKTWRELRKISPEGQSDAGARAERKIAEAIAELLKELVPLHQKERA